MAPKKKQVWKQDESAKEARRARSKRENERNAEANAKSRIEESVQSKFVRERASIPPPNAMNKKVESSSLVKAMKNGFLDSLKMFRVKDHKVLVSTLLHHSNVYVSYIINDLQSYFHSLGDDALERGRVERLLAYFEDDDWEEFEFQTTSHLIHVLQANDFYYAKNLWENENTWKEDWKTKSMGKWKLLHPLRIKEMQDRIEKRTTEDSNSEKEDTTTTEGATTSFTIGNRVKSKSKAKPKIPSKGKSIDKGKGKDKNIGKGKDKSKG